MHRHAGGGGLRCQFSRSQQSPSRFSGSWRRRRALRLALADSWRHGDEHTESAAAAAAFGFLHRGDSVQFANLCLPAGHLLRGHVAAGVLRQVVAAHKAALAHGAGELLLPRVSSAVAGQFVRAGKLLVAAFPVAAERLFSCRTRKKHNLLSLCSISSKN